MVTVAHQEFTLLTIGFTILELHMHRRPDRASSLRESNESTELRRRSTQLADVYTNVQDLRARRRELRC